MAGTGAKADWAARRFTRATGAICAAVIVLSVPAASVAAPHAARHGCCRVAAGAPVQVELAQQVGSATQKPGDTFAIRLAAPLVVDGMVVARKGTPGVGEVIDASKPGIGGKPAKMVLGARYLTTPHGRVQLSALQLARPGRNHSRASQVLGLGGMAFMPLSIVGIVVPGGDVVFKPGTIATAKVAKAVSLAPLGRATRQEIAAAATAAGEDATAVEGPIAVPPPPAGEGQVVFFRAKSLLGTGQWFNVREDGKALGKLSNGAYFVYPARPGIHTFTARFEPELKDHLKLKIDPGETYFVEGETTGGLVLGAANLTPSTRGRFEKVAKDLKPAGAPGSDKEEREAQGKARAGRNAAEAPPPTR